MSDPATTESMPRAAGFPCPVHTIYITLGYGTRRSKIGHPDRRGTATPARLDRAGALFFQGRRIARHLPARTVEEHPHPRALTRSATPGAWQVRSVADDVRTGARTPRGCDRRGTA